jgi:hypothetical protein
MKGIVMHQPDRDSENGKLSPETEVKETLAGDANVLVRKRNFTAADLWHRNKSRRSAGEMIRRWNLN